MIEDTNILDTRNESVKSITIALKNKITDRIVELITDRSWKKMNR